MPDNNNHPEKPLRLLPGLIILTIVLIMRFILPVLNHDLLAIAMMSGLAGMLAIIIWWAFFSRASRIERFGAPILIIMTLFLVYQFLDISISTGGQGLMFFIYVTPPLCITFVLWAVFTRKHPLKIRFITMAVIILITSVFWLFVRNNGITNDFRLDLAWRWSKTHEEILLTDLPKDESSFKATITSDTKNVWPGFRGPQRNGVVRGTSISTDWSTSKPKELWRRPIGPGCSSCAIQGSFLFTQEQLGAIEIVSCYNLNTGEPVWKHQDSTRFWDSHAGAGPRATPTLHGNKLFSLGATGILNALNATNGSVLWTRNAAIDVKAKTPGWGFSGSPLIVNDNVIVAVAGTAAAYSLSNGELIWAGPDGEDGYSSPHLITVDSTRQVVLMSMKGATSFNPEDGTVLWQISMPEEHIIQPAVLQDRDLILSLGSEKGLRRVSLSNTSGAWKTDERWTTKQFRPGFNDFVIHKGYAYGLNGYNLICVDIQDGKKKWKAGHYGGQILLLADQDLIVILSETGDLVLAEATPDQFNELGIFKAIEGKTWNHPAMAGNIIVVRNAEEMAAFQL